MVFFGISKLSRSRKKGSWYTLNSFELATSDRKLEATCAPATTDDYYVGLTFPTVFRAALHDSQEVPNW